MPKSRGDAGFALIGALWLLILGSGIVGLLMLRAVENSRDARDGVRETIERQANASAAQTIAAELLLLGPNSHWSRVPARGQVEVDGTIVQVELTSDESRIDINQVDPVRLDQYFRDLKMSASDRQRVVARVISERPFHNIAEARSALGVRIGSIPCLGDTITIYSGLPEPKGDQKNDALASSMPVPLGVPLRMILTSPSGIVVSAIVRVTPSANHPLSILAWNNGRFC